MLGNSSEVIPDVWLISVCSPAIAECAVAVMNNISNSLCLFFMLYSTYRLIFESDYVLIPWCGENQEQLASVKILNIQDLTKNKR
jgi:hypothetical protein